MTDSIEICPYCQHEIKPMPKVKKFKVPLWLLYLFQDHSAARLIDAFKAIPRLTITVTKDTNDTGMVEVEYND